jgi:hypothetical protein
MILSLYDNQTLIKGRGNQGALGFSDIGTFLYSNCIERGDVMAKRQDLHEVIVAGPV